MLLGSIGIVDLRVMGAFARLPLRPLSEALTPVGLAGLALLAPTGFTLFAADASALIGSSTFGWKLAGIALALTNALWFRWQWRGAEATPALRLSAVVSLALWMGVMICGRMIAYS